MPATMPAISRSLHRRFTNLGVPRIDLHTGDNHGDFENAIMIPEIPEIEHKIQNISKSISKKSFLRYFPFGLTAPGTRSGAHEWGQKGGQGAAESVQEKAGHFGGK